MDREGVRTAYTLPPLYDLLRRHKVPMPGIRSHFPTPSPVGTPKQSLDVFQGAHQSAPFPSPPPSPYFPTLPHTSPHLSWYWMSSSEFCTLATSWLKAGMERRSAASTDLKEGGGGERGGTHRPEAGGEGRGVALTDLREGEGRMGGGGGENGGSMRGTG